MGRQVERAQLFYEFSLERHVPADHLLRRLDAALDLTWLRAELAPFYSAIGRPSIDPELMIRMARSWVTATGSAPNGGFATRST